MIKSPFIITNFKVYPQSTGVEAIKLAQLHLSIAKSENITLGVAPQALDLNQICTNVNIPVFSQHIDPITWGKGTGKIIPESVKKHGAIGTILNHSEYKLEWSILEKSIKRAKEVGLLTIVCAATPEEGGKIAKEFNPDYIAVEPPELIGGNISVSTAQPEIITKSVKLIGSEKLIIGAGIKTSADVKIALKLGAKGILLASGVIKAKNPETILKELAQGLK